MKHIKILMCAIFLLSCILTTGLFAEETKPLETRVAEVGSLEKASEEKVIGSISLGVFNKYMFRGYELSRGSFVVQPAITASYKDFSVTWVMWTATLTIRSPIFQAPSIEKGESGSTRPT